MGELAPKFEEKHSPLPPSRPRMPVCVMLWTTLRSHTTQTIRPCLRPTILKYYSPSLNRNGAPRTARFLSDKAQPTGVMPSFREQVARSSEPVSFSEKVKRPSIRNQIFVSMNSSLAMFIILNAINAVLPSRIIHSIWPSSDQNQYRYRALVEEDIRDVLRLV